MHASALILFPPAPACPAELQTFPDMRGIPMGMPWDCMHPACCLPRAPCPRAALSLLTVPSPSRFAGAMSKRRHCYAFDS